MPIATERAHTPTVLRSAHNGERLLELGRYSRATFSPDSLRLGLCSRTNVQLYELGMPLQPPYATIALDSVALVPPPLAFSPDGGILAVAARRTHVTLYETSTGRELATLTPPNLAPILGPKALTFSPDGQWLIAAKEDGETIAWNLVVTRRELAELGLDWEVLQK